MVAVAEYLNRSDSQDTGAGAVVFGDSMGSPRSQHALSRGSGVSQARDATVAGPDRPAKQSPASVPTSPSHRSGRQYSPRASSAGRDRDAGSVSSAGHNGDTRRLREAAMAQARLLEEKLAQVSHLVSRNDALSQEVLDLRNKCVALENQCAVLHQAATAAGRSMSPFSFLPLAGSFPQTKQPSFRAASPLSETRAASLPPAVGGASLSSAVSPSPAALRTAQPGSNRSITQQLDLATVPAQGVAADQVAPWPQHRGEEHSPSPDPLELSGTLASVDVEDDQERPRSVARPSTAELTMVALANSQHISPSNALSVAVAASATAHLDTSHVQPETVNEGAAMPQSGRRPSSAGSNSPRRSSPLRPVSQVTAPQAVLSPGQVDWSAIAGKPPVSKSTRSQSDAGIRKPLQT